MCERDFRKEYKCRTEWVRGERWKFGRFENGQDREAHDTVAFWTFDTLEVRKMSVTTKKLKEYSYKCPWVMVRGLCRGRIFCSHVGSVEKIMGAMFLNLSDKGVVEERKWTIALLEKFGICR